ncbi:MAG: HDIG domain-containing protein [Nanoarchaeota archaeon]|nr:HDIG domain-containing protein [Nanoarchaeota archaeon]
MDANKVIELWEKYEFFDNLKEHSIRVAAIALFIADKFIEEGKEVDKELVKYGALLHDIGKMHNLLNIDNRSHRIIGTDILIEKGYPKLAKISEEHWITVVRGDKFSFPESEIVSIADATVGIDGFQTFDGRIDCLRKRKPEEKETLEIARKNLIPYFKRFFDEEENFRKIAKELTEKLDFKNKTYKQLIEAL